MKLVILAGVIMDSQQQEPKHTPLWPNEHLQCQLQMGCSQAIMGSSGFDGIEKGFLKWQVLWPNEAKKIFLHELLQKFSIKTNSFYLQWGCWKQRVLSGEHHLLHLPLLMQGNYQTTDSKTSCSKVYSQLCSRAPAILTCGSKSHTDDQLNPHPLNPSLDRIPTSLLWKGKQYYCSMSKTRSV